VFLMWLGLAACGAGLSTLAFGFGFEFQVVAFGVLAAVTLTIGLWVRRSRPVVHTESAGLVGRPATALVFHGRDGRVRLGDSEWAAQVPPGVAAPEPGARLRVAGVEGTVVIVRPDL
jgi:membrane protein implicated in regulation of membrane protease activity